jgi:hypothetical protein
MSIDDRDYVIEHRLARQAAEEARDDARYYPKDYRSCSNEYEELPLIHKNVAPRAQFSWIACIGLVAFVAFVAHVSGRPPEKLRVLAPNLSLIQEESFPPHGQIMHKFTTQSMTAPLRLTGAIHRKFVVQLLDWRTGAPLLVVYLREGGNVEVPVPLGTYRLAYASGVSWEGGTRLFGSTTRRYSEPAPLQFRQSASGSVVGVSVELASEP